MTATQANYLTAVRDQYEDYPYPNRNPKDEKKRLLVTYADPLELINFYCFEGRQDFRNRFRVLVAGGGTGDGVIYLAEQLRTTNAEIVYVDLSSASMAIAQERAEIRGLTNITWHNESLLNLPKLGFEPFDYINCSGVLHHLASPEEGLAALNSVLKPDGAMSIMLYAWYGRRAIYHMQDLMRLMASGTPDKSEKVALFKQVLKALPSDHSIIQQRATFDPEVTQEGDIGIYDMFLHSQDRAYTVPQLYAFLETQKLHLQGFTYHGGVAKSMYNPASYISDPALLGLIQTFDIPTQYAVAETLSGKMTMHSFFCTRQPRAIPMPVDMEQVPFFCSQLPPDLQKQLLAKMPINAVQVIEMHIKWPVPCFVKFESSPVMAALLQHIDGVRTIDEVLTLTAQTINLPTDNQARQAFFGEWLKLYQALNLHDWLVLRHRTVTLPKAKTL